MCAGCVSTLDAALLGVSGVAVAAKVTWERHLAGPIHRSRRAADSWDDAAGLLTRLGHEPESIIGPPPTVTEPALAPPAAGHADDGLPDIQGLPALSALP